MANLEVGDIVMCTVERIAGTTVFVKIDGNGEGSIVLSEIAPGRIRNLRNYVVPKKRIICKILRASGSHIDLSLRRVTPKEQKEVREIAKTEKSTKALLKNILGEKSKQVINKIEENYTIIEFLDTVKKHPKELEKLVDKTSAKKITDALKNQKQKLIILKKNFTLKSQKSNGITLIKNILKKIKDAQVNYISAGKYSISAQGNDPKKIDNSLKELLNTIEKEAKKEHMEFNLS